MLVVAGESHSTVVIECIRHVSTLPTEALAEGRHRLIAPGNTSSRPLQALSTHQPPSSLLHPSNSMLGLQKNLTWRLQRSSTLPAQCPLHATCNAPPRHQYVNQQLPYTAATHQHRPHRHMLAAAAPAASPEQQLHPEVEADNGQEQQQAELQVNDHSNSDEAEDSTSTEAGFVELGISKLFMVSSFIPCTACWLPSAAAHDRCRCTDSPCGLWLAWRSSACLHAMKGVVSH